MHESHDKSQTSFSPLAEANWQVRSPVTLGECPGSAQQECPAENQEGGSVHEERCPGSGNELPPADLLLASSRAAAAGDADQPRSQEGVPRLVWLAATILLMLSIRYFVPWFAEEIQFAITRGRERAEFEVASARLDQAPLAQLSEAGQLVSKRISPSVVSVRVTAVRETRLDDDTPFHAFGAPRSDISGQGSGVVVAEEGFILTNYHVVKGALSVEVGLSDGRRVAAQLVGFDAPTDLAVLKVDAPRLIAAAWGKSDDVDVGALVWAAGSPFGLESSVTFGILSAKHRGGIAGTPYQDFLQTDAAVNPGNSGGPLVDDRGRIIGINTAIVGEAYQGVSFAVPSQVAREVYERLRDDGRVARGWLGVQMQDVSETLAAEIGLPRAYGVLVANVVSIAGTSPAEAAGIQVGDVIVGWNGNEVGDPTVLSRLVAMTQIGTAAQVRVRRGQDELQLQVAVAERPELDRPLVPSRSRR